VTLHSARVGRPAHLLTLSGARGVAAAWCVAALAPFARLTAQAPAGPTGFRPLGPIVARLADTLSGAPTLVELGNGSIFVNDMQGLRVLVVDSTLAHPHVVLDSKGLGTRTYGHDVGTLMPYGRDSVAFFDPTAIGLLVMDDTGGIARVISAPAGNDASTLVSGAFSPVIDGAGRLVFQTRLPPIVPAGCTPTAAATPLVRDSGIIVRADLRTRAADTLARVKLAIPPPMIRRTGADGVPVIQSTVDPLLSKDKWVAWTTGEIAILRSRDYHVDWIDSAGRLAPTKPVAHEWHRLTDSEKVALSDSVQKAIDAQAAIRAAPAPNATRYISAAVPAADLADYAPPFLNAYAGGDGTIWVQSGSIKPPAGGPVYDVIDAHGQLIDRVQIPGGCSLVAVGHGVVYISSREGRGVVLARARIR